MPWNQVPKKWKAGTLHSGSPTGPVVKNQKQMVAIMLSEKRASKTKSEYRSDQPMKKAKSYQAGTSSVPGYLKSSPIKAQRSISAKGDPGFASESEYNARPPTPSVPYYRALTSTRLQKGTSMVKGTGAPPMPMPVGPPAKAALPQAKIHVNRHSANAGQMPVLPHAKTHMQRNAANPPAGSMPAPPKGPAFPVSAPVNPNY